MSSDPKLIPFVLPLIQGNDILDVGCGKGKWGFLCRVDFWYTSSGRKKQEIGSLIGVDLFVPYLKSAKHHKIYDDLVRASATNLPFAEKSFDSVLVMEILEHLPKALGGRVLDEAEKIGRLAVVATTPFNPTGFHRQTAKEGNVFQEHVAKWSRNDFVRRGYRTIGRPFPFEKWVNFFIFLFPPFSAFFPQLPVCLIATKSKLGGVCYG